MTGQGTDNTAERRKYIRLPSSHMLCHEKYTLRGHKEQTMVEGILKNYSGGGVLFESTIRYDIGDLLKLEIALPGWERFKNEFYKEDRLSRSDPVVVLASVVRVECMGPPSLFDVGVCFVGIDEDDRWAVIKQIDAQLQK